MRRLELGLATLGAGLVLVSAAAAHGVDGQADDWTGRATMEPGTAAYDGGEWAYTDYVYDDDGAGDFTYPGGSSTSEDPVWGRNAADVAVLRIAADEDAVHYLVELNTLILADTTVAALAVDTDGNEATGGGEWPHGAGISSAGWEMVITARGSTADVTFADGTVEPVEVAVDMELNRMEFSVQRSLADPGTSTWRYRGAAGLWNAETGAWQEAFGKGDPSHPNVYNLLFRNRLWDGGTAATDENENSGRFQSRRQNEALSAGDIEPFFRDVDFSKLASGSVEFPEPPPGDQHTTRIYASSGFPNDWHEGLYPSFSLEGFDIDGNIFNGRFHPYRLFVPASYRENSAPAPMIPLLHGWGGDHKGFSPADDPFWNDVVRAKRVLVPKPFGAGQRVWYEHLGELDVLEVIRDVQSHYVIDPDRIYLGGTSMGGLGTIKIAEAHPDLFAGILPSVPPMSDRATGYAVPAANEWDLVEQADSLLNVPARVFAGTFDALVPAGVDPTRFCTRLKLLEYDHDCWRDFGPNGTHRTYNADRADEIALLMDQHVRNPNPARVVYEVHPVWARHADERGIDHALRYDRAYWVSNVVLDDNEINAANIEASPGRVPESLDCRALPDGNTCFGELDVRTFGLGAGVPVSELFVENPEPTLLRDGMVVSEGDPLPVENRFTARIANLEGFDLDLGRMGLGTTDAGEPLRGTIVADDPNPPQFRLGLVTDGEACTATFGGEAVPVVRDGVRIVVDLTVANTETELVVGCE